MTDHFNLGPGPLERRDLPTGAVTVRTDLLTPAQREALMTALGFRAVGRGQYVNDHPAQAMPPSTVTVTGVHFTGYDSQVGDYGSMELRLHFTYHDVEVTTPASETT